MMSNWFPWSRPVFKEPKLKFGRYSDSHKDDIQIEYWNKALSTFEEKKYLEAYDFFFKYIADEDEGNVQYENKGDKIEFKIQQGSKVIEGYFDKDFCHASAVVAQFKKPSVVFMRKLLEFNYQLKYSRYSLDGNNIKLSFHSSTIDGSPEKLYYALREVATHADRQDDILISEFESLSQLDNEFIVPIAEEVKEIKHRYINIWINQAFNLINQLDSNQNDQIIAQILVCTAFKIDYLVVPHGKLMNQIEKIQHTHLVPDGASRTEKNDTIIKIFDKILQTPKAEIFDELYATKATFGVTQPAAHEYIFKFISEESPKSSYIKNQQQYQIHSFIQEYLIQHILYYWGVNPPTQALLHLLIRVINDTYFVELGFKPALFEPMNKNLNQKAILVKIDEIVKMGKERYKHFEIDKNNIKFDSIPLFVESVLEQIKILNYD